MTVSALIARSLAITVFALPITAAATSSSRTSTSTSTTRLARHEVTDNRATLVLRDDRHVSVTLYLNYLEALHRALAPGRTSQEFVLRFAAMPLAQLQTALNQAHRRFENATRLSHSSGGTIALSNWTWPDATRVQSLLQQQAMQTVVAPDAHVHEQPTEVRADAIATSSISAAHIRFPAEFERVLVVSYKPHQVWASPAGASPRITF